MNIDTELLWRAWPDGCLAKRGVGTIGGYDCIDERRENVDSIGILFYPQGTFYSTWRRRLPDVRLGYFERVDARPTRSTHLYVGDCTPPGFPDMGAWIALHTGDRDSLLPHVDPGDVSTWACLVADLAASRGWIGVARGGCTWERLADHGVTSWVLRLFRGGDGGHETYTFGSTLTTNMETSDPALALVMARIQTREQDAQLGNLGVSHLRDVEP